jgi:RNA polymerase sigma factor (sigma-70 family)
MTSANDRVPPADRAGDNEAELLRRIASADLVAFEALYDLYGSTAYGVALRITFDEALAQDVVQDAFISVWRHAARFDPARGSVKTWLMAIVHHRAVDEIRLRGRTEALPEGDEDPPAPLTLPDVWVEVAERFDATAVRLAFAGLPEPQREALRLAYYEGLTQEEIAVRTNAPLGTVKGRTRLGLQAMRRLIDEPGSRPAADGGAAAGGAATRSDGGAATRSDGGADGATSARPAPSGGASADGGAARGDGTASPASAEADR